MGRPGAPHAWRVLDSDQAGGRFSNMHSDDSAHCNAGKTKFRSGTLRLRF